QAHVHVVTRLGQPDSGLVRHQPASTRDRTARVAALVAAMTSAPAAAASTAALEHGIRFAVDRGGTFTDVLATLPDGETRVLKLLSVDPAYPDAPREGIRRLLEVITGVPHPRGAPVSTRFIHSIRM